MKAIDIRDPLFMAEALRNGADPDIGITSGMLYIIPLSAAVVTGEIDLVKLLLLKGARLRICLETLRRCRDHILEHPICLAADKGRADIIHLLLDYGVPPYKPWKRATGMHLRDLSGPVVLSVLAMGGLETAQRCIDAGGDIADAEFHHLHSSRKSHYLEMFENRKYELYQFLVQHRAFHAWPFKKPFLRPYDGDSEFWQQVACIDARLNSIDGDWEPTLPVVVGSETQDLVQMLIADGAVVTAKDRYGVSPLLYAVFYGHLDVVERLLECGSDANDAFEDAENTAVGSLHHFGKYQICNLLSLALPSAAPRGTWSALQLAAYRNFHRIFSILIEGGADPLYRSSDGKTALDVAIVRQHYEIAFDLLKIGVPFTSESPEVGLLIDLAINGYKDELAILLVEGGAKPTPTYLQATLESSSAHEVRKRIQTIQSLLDDATKSLVIKAAETARSTLCPTCEAFFRQLPRFPNIWAPADGQLDTLCVFCALVRDSFPETTKPLGALFRGGTGGDEKPYCTSIWEWDGVERDHEIKQLPGMKRP
jgi:ankyrin repeat protein